MRRCEQLPLLAGALCLDFANTLEYRASPRELDALRSTEDVLLWGARVGGLSLGSPKGARPGSGGGHLEATQQLDAARAFREAIYAVFSALAGGRSPDAKALATLNCALAPRFALTEIRTSGGAAIKCYTGPSDRVELVLWAVAWSVHDLLMGDDLGRIRECADNECHWLFVDRSRNRSRRWCDMANCGNLAKVRRFRQRA